MTNFPNSSRLVKGVIVGVDAMNQWSGASFQWSVIGYQCEEACRILRSSQSGRRRIN